MATLAEKLRACAVLGGFGVIDVEDFDGDQRQVLTLSGDDLKTIADALEKNGDAAGTIGALNAELDAAKTEVATLKAKLEESAVVAEAVAWLVGGQSPVVTTSAAAAQICSKDGLDVVPLYLRPPAAEALPSREDLETVLVSALKDDSVDLIRGDHWASLVEDDGAYSVIFHNGRSANMTLAEAIAEAAALIRAKKAGA